MAARLKWGCSSVGRAPALQAGGHEFESHHLHSGRNSCTHCFAVCNFAEAKFGYIENCISKVNDNSLEMMNSQTSKLLKYDLSRTERGIRNDVKSLLL